MRHRKCVSMEQHQSICIICAGPERNVTLEEGLASKRIGWLTGASILCAAYSEGWQRA